MDVAELKKEVLYECARDHVGLWELVWMTADELGTDDESDPRVRTTALTAAANLLKAGHISVGFPNGRTGFYAWELSPEEAIARIGREWDALGCEPDIGEIVWFDITREGKKNLKELDR